jgi:hypothetical protein
MSFDFYKRVISGSSAKKEPKQGKNLNELKGVKI